MRSACMWEKMASLKKLLQLWLCQRELGSTVRQRESWVSTRAVFSPGNWAGPLLSHSFPPFLPPSLLSGFLTLAHPYALSPLLAHMCVLSLLLLTNLGYCKLFFALCTSSPFSLSWARSLPTTNCCKEGFGKKCGTGFGALASVPVCELGKKKWHVLAFTPL